VAEDYIERLRGRMTSPKDVDPAYVEGIGTSIYLDARCKG